VRLLLLGLVACSSDPLECRDVPQRLCRELAPARRAVQLYPKDRGPTLHVDVPRDWIDYQPMTCPHDGHLELCNAGKRLDENFEFTASYGDPKDAAGKIAISIGRDDGAAFEARVFGNLRAAEHVAIPRDTGHAMTVNYLDAPPYTRIVRAWRVDGRLRWCDVTLNEAAAAATLFESICDRVE
jgi:hypothetical protein